MLGRSRTLSGLTAVAIAAALTVAGPVQPAAATGQRGAAFVWNYWASPPLGEPYTPSGGYQYNSTSPDAPNNVIRRDTVGRYTVVIPGLTGFAVTHATAYGWDAATATRARASSSTPSRSSSNASTRSVRRSTTSSRSA